MNQHDITGAKALVRFLCKNGLKWYREDTQLRPWCQTFKAIGGPLSIHGASDTVDSVFLKSTANGEDSKGEINHPHILLKPPSSNKHIVCLLGIRWALNPASTRMTLYLHTFGQSQHQDTDLWYRGYRLELPHGSGTHNYTHVQPVTVFKSNAGTRFEDASVPDAFPSFPLRGHNLTTLCAALAIALHGTVVLTDLLAQLRGHQFETVVKDLFLD